MIFADKVKLMCENDVLFLICDRNIFIDICADACGRTEGFMRLIRSFKYAFKGIWCAIITETNMRVHISTAILIFLISPYYNFSKTDFFIILAAIFAVIVLEMLNSAVERTCDLVTKEQNDDVKHIKDITAGAVLLGTVFAVCIGITFFVDIGVIKNIIYDVFADKLKLAAAIVYVILAALFIIFVRNRRGKHV
jgi:diacylglycerol kinase